MLSKVEISQKIFIAVILIAVLTMFLPNSKGYAVDTILKVAFNPNLPPYQFIENDEYVGMHIDIMNKLAERYNFIIEYVPIESTSKCLEALSDGKVDVVLGVIIKDYPKYKIEFTDSITQSSVCMIAHNSIVEDIQNKTRSFLTTFEDDTVSYSFTYNIDNLHALVVSNQVRAFNLLTSKKVDILLGVKSSILYQLEKANLENQYTIVNNFLVPIQYGMAVRLGDEELREKINNGLYQLRISGSYQNIYDKWINEDEYLIREKIKNVVYSAMIGLSTLGGIFVFNLRLNFLLKKQVNEKTKELRKINDYLEKQIVETRNNNELRNCIVENSPSGIIVFDRECKITLFNNSASKLLGIPEAPIGQSIFQIELLKKIFEDKMHTLFLKDSKFLNKEIIFKDSDGQKKTYRYNIYQLFDLNNNVRGAILAFEDITREIQIKERIYEREKNKALNQIVAGIAHEIRNPLATVKTFIELIPVKLNNIEFQNNLLKLVPKEIDRVNNLIKNLIDYAKPASNNIEVIFVKDVIESCTGLLSYLLENEKISLKIELEDGLMIKGDRSQIQQILINIILNGIEAMKEKIKNNDIAHKLKMHIKAWKNEKYVFIQIIDEGMGMTEDEVRKSTEPFFTTKANGSGLGLYIAKQYIEKNGGSILIESEKNQYTRILLTFGGNNGQEYFDN